MTKTSESATALTPSPEKPASEKAAPKGSAVAPRASQGQIVASIADEMEAMAGAGLENVNATDILIPRIAILQSLSYQLQRNRPQFMPDAKVGNFCDVGLNELLEGTSLNFVPVYYIKQWLEWRPNRKGLAGIHNSPDILSQCTPNEKRQPTLSTGNTIQETAQFYGLLPDYDMRKCFVPMASTQLKKAKQLNTLATSEKIKRRDGSDMTPPLFYRSYTLGTVSESNEQGAWEGWKIDRGPRIEEMENGVDIFHAARDFLKSIIEGRATADVESMQSEPEVVGSGKTSERM